MHDGIISDEYPGIQVKRKDSLINVEMINIGGELLFHFRLESGHFEHLEELFQELEKDKDTWIVDGEKRM